MITALMLIAVILIIMIFFVYQNPSEKIIGNDKDENGCLISAGYSWSEDFQVCVRQWELDTDEVKSAVKIATDTIENKEGLTLSMIEKKDCDGCYYMVFTNNGNAPFSISVVGMEIKDSNLVFCSEDLRNADYCITLYEPVCGYNSKNQGETFSNNCFACSSEQIGYYLKGECLE